MTNFEIARLYTGMSAVELARLLEVSPQQLNGWLKGIRVPSRTNVEYMAAKMGVDAAWLLGVPQSVLVIDHETGEWLMLPIIHSEAIDGYGVLYIVWCEEIGTWIPVLQCPDSAVQFTPADWQSPYNPRRVEEIGDGRWVDHLGHDAVMIDGLPRTMA